MTHVIKTDGSIKQSSATTVGGSDTQVQFNDGGSSLGGDAGLTYSKTTDTLTVAAQVTVGGNSTSSGIVRLLEDSDNGSNYIDIKAPAAVTSNTTLTLPDGAGSADQVLSTNGSGTLSWATASAGSCVLVATGTASASATIDFTGLSSTYAAYIFTWDSVVPATDAAHLHCRMGTGAGPTWDSGANYGWSLVFDNEASSSGFSAGTGDTSIKLLNSCGNAANEIGNGKIMLYNPSLTAGYHSLNFETGFTNSANSTIFYNGQGTYKSATAVTGLRFFMTTGNITSGNFWCYGLKAS